MEMISAILYQLTRNLTPEEIREGGFDAYFVDHTTGVYPQFASGTPWSAMTFQSKGDPITDLMEDMAADGTTAQEQSMFRNSSGFRWGRPWCPECGGRPRCSR